MSSRSPVSACWRSDLVFAGLVALTIALPVNAQDPERFPEPEYQYDNQLWDFSDGEDRNANDRLTLALEDVDHVQSEIQTSIAEAIRRGGYRNVDEILEALSNGGECPAGVSSYDFDELRAKLSPTRLPLERLRLAYSDVIRELRGKGQTAAADEKEAQAIRDLKKLNYQFDGPLVVWRTLELSDLENVCHWVHSGRGNDPSLAHFYGSDLTAWMRLRVEDGVRQSPNSPTWKVWEAIRKSAVVQSQISDERLLLEARRSSRFYGTIGRFLAAGGSVALHSMADDAYAEGMQDLGDSYSADASDLTQIALNAPPQSEQESASRENARYDVVMKEVNATIAQVVEADYLGSYLEKCFPQPEDTTPSNLHVTLDATRVTIRNRSEDDLRDVYFFCRADPFTDEEQEDRLETRLKRLERQHAAASQPTPRNKNAAKAEKLQTAIYQLSEELENQRIGWKTRLLAIESLKPRRPLRVALPRHAAKQSVVVIMVVDQVAYRLKTT